VERAYLTSLRSVADDCAAGAGGELPCLSTEQTVRNRDAIRAEPSERTANLLGVSYGARLGAACAARSPHRTGRMVLDSVGGPWDWSDFDVLQSRGTAAPTRGRLGWATIAEADPRTVMRE
jgi:pimeloyl-ACP methyl ester carboxylesterase